jgi:excinuclease UvrABC ATPase subunit
MTVAQTTNRRQLSGHGKVQNLSLLKNAVSTWATITEGTEWLLLFHSCIEQLLLSSCSNKADNRKFCFTVVQNLLEMNARESLILIPPQEEDHTHQPIK